MVITFFYYPDWVSIYKFSFRKIVKKKAQNIIQFHTYTSTSLHLHLFLVDRFGISQSCATSHMVQNKQQTARLPPNHEDKNKIHDWCK